MNVDPAGKAATQNPRVEEPDTDQGLPASALPSWPTVPGPETTTEPRAPIGPITTTFPSSRRGLGCCENLSSSTRRSSRGYAAAQVFVTMLLVAFNMRRIAAFQSQLDRPEKIYESKPSTFYTPYPGKRKMIRVEKAATALVAEALKLDPPTRN